MPLKSGADESELASLVASRHAPSVGKGVGVHVHDFHHVVAPLRIGHRKDDRLGAEIQKPEAVDDVYVRGDVARLDRKFTLRNSPSLATAEPAASFQWPDWSPSTKQPRRRVKLPSKPHNGPSAPTWAQPTIAKRSRLRRQGPIDFYVEDVMLHGTAESVTDQIRALEADGGMTYLMAAPP